MLKRPIGLDANILLRAALGRGARKLIDTHRESGTVCAPEPVIAEAAEHLPQILERRNLDFVAPLAAFKQVLSVVEPVEIARFAQRKAAALLRIKRRDPEDWPVLACALMLDCPIWTEDQDFFGVGVATWTSDRVSIYFDEAVPR